MIEFTYTMLVIGKMIWKIFIWHSDFLVQQFRWKLKLTEIWGWKYFRNATSAVQNIMRFIKASQTDMISLFLEIFEFSSIVPASGWDKGPKMTVFAFFSELRSVCSLFCNQRRLDHNRKVNLDKDYRHWWWLCFGGSSELKTIAQVIFPHLYNYVCLHISL